MQVILDTNILLLPFQSSMQGDVFEYIAQVCPRPLEIAVLEGTLRELEQLTATTKKGKDAKAAEVGLQLIKAKDLKILPQLLSSVDDELVRLSGEGIIVATLDKELRSRIKEKGGSLLIIKKNQAELI